MNWENSETTEKLGVSGSVSLGHPDPLVRDTDPDSDPDPSIIKQN